MRKVITVKIDEEGRDKGKTFVITEMSAAHSEEWAARVLFAGMNAGIEIPDDIAMAGLAGLASLGIRALTKIPFEMAKPLLDEMMECVQYQPSEGVVRALIDDDIEEVSTRLRLRKQALTLHLGPFIHGDQSTSDRPAAKTKGSSTT